MLAVPRGEVGIVARLLAAGADVDLRDREGRSGLHLAAAPEAAGIDVVDTLLGAGANRHAADARGWRPFDLAVANGRADLLDALYAREQDLDRALPSGATPLFLAAECKHAGVVEKLLALGASVDVLDSQGESALFAAVRAEQDEIVRRLLAHGADVNRANNRAAVPLHFALGARNAALVALLLEQGAAQDQPYQRELPLHWVAQDGSLDAAARVTMLNALLAGEIEVDTLDSRGHTALHLAADSGSLPAARQLVEHGADLDARDGREQTPQQLAAHGRHAEVLNFLRDAQRGAQGGE